MESSCVANKEGGDVRKLHHATLSFGEPPDDRGKPDVFRDSCFVLVSNRA